MSWIYRNVHEKDIKLYCRLQRRSDIFLTVDVDCPRDIDQSEATCYSYMLISDGRREQDKAPVHLTSRSGGTLHCFYSQEDLVKSSCLSKIIFSEREPIRAN